MRARNGVALLDVLVAIMLIALAGSSLAMLLGQTRRTMRNVRDAERTMRGASHVLQSLTEFDRAGLRRLEGRSARGAYRLTVQEREGGLFDVSVAVSDTSPPLLTTVLYRSDSTHAGE